jgi:hypothetical protein
MPALSRARHAAPAATALLAVTMTGCGSSPPATGTGARNAGHRPAITMPPMKGMDRTPAGTAKNMSGMGPVARSNGLSAAADGYLMASSLITLPAAVPAAYTFTITAPDGIPLTNYATDQTEQLNFYAIRSDLTGLQHVLPVMAPDGIWTAPLAALTPGQWRLYAAFAPATGPAAGTRFILSRTITVPGAYAAVPLPAAAAVTTDDGYAIITAGYLMPGVALPLTLTITRHGQPVTTLAPDPGTYPHLTAFHAGDLAFARPHLKGPAHVNDGGTTLTFNTNLPETGPWRLFLQFQANGWVHTIPITVDPEPLTGSPNSRP